MYPFIYLPSFHLKTLNLKATNLSFRGGVNHKHILTFQDPATSRHILATPKVELMLVIILNYLLVTETSIYIYTHMHKGPEVHHVCHNVYHFDHLSLFEYWTNTRSIWKISAWEKWWFSHYEHSHFDIIPSFWREFCFFRTQEGIVPRGNVVNHPCRRWWTLGPSVHVTMILCTILSYITRTTICKRRLNVSVCVSSIEPGAESGLLYEGNNDDDPPMVCLGDAL